MFALGLVLSFFSKILFQSLRPVPPTLNSQDIIKNQNKDKKTTLEDDFDF